MTAADFLRDHQDHLITTFILQQSRIVIYIKIIIYKEASLRYKGIQTFFGGKEKWGKKKIVLENQKVRTGNGYGLFLYLEEMVLLRRSSKFQG